MRAYLVKKKVGLLTLNEKLGLIGPNDPNLSLTTQFALLQLAKSTYYYQSNKLPEVSKEDEALMKEIDKVYTEFPYYGSRKITRQLFEDLGKKVNRKRVRRLMAIMGIEAVYPKPNFSKPEPGHTIYPYLLKGVSVRFPNHVWGTDITYVPLAKGWLYLVAILDWYSRYVISWELSDTLTVGFCVEALKKALNVAIPGIHNSDRGSQFTADDYLTLLKEKPEIRISMDGRGRFFDNIFTERLWRSVKYEEVYIHDYQSFADAKASLTNYFEQYNFRRLHQSLDYVTPAEVYYGSR